MTDLPARTPTPGPSPEHTLARALAEATSGERPDRGQVRRVLGLAASSARTAGARAVTSGRWLAEVTLDAADHIPVRNLDALREHHDGLAGSLLAGALIRNAAMATAGVGAAAGALAAASELTPGTWASLPVELAAETLLVVAIELKLVGELHEAAGIALPRDPRDKGAVIARAWAESRGIRAADIVRIRDGLQATASGQIPGILAGAASELVGRNARDQLTGQIRKRLVRRTGRNLTTWAPFLAGAVAGGALNRRATRTLGGKVADSLGIPPPSR